MGTEADHDYAELLGFVADLVDAQAGRPGADEWLQNAQVLSRKFFFHLVSMKTLAGGGLVRLDEARAFSFVDHGSLDVVTRAAWETFLVFSFIYGTEDRTLGRFRHAAWILGGLTTRQRWFVKSPEHRARIEAERRECEALRMTLTGSPHLKEYSPKQRDRLLSGDWRVGYAWGDIAKAAGFHEKYFRDTYQYLCAYSHSDYISALQILTADNSVEQGKLARSVLGIGKVLMGHFIYRYCR